MKLVLPVVAVMLLALLGQASARTSAGSEPSTSAACAPGYKPCLPIRADLDCKDIPDEKTPVRVTGSDPYRLDADRDGLGCELGGGAGGRLSPVGLIIRKPIRKEATLVRVGQLVWAAGWSPKGSPANSSSCAPPRLAVAASRALARSVESCRFSAAGGSRAGTSRAVSSG
jgi:hypothetical protein